MQRRCVLAVVALLSLLSAGRAPAEERSAAAQAPAAPEEETTEDDSADRDRGDDSEAVSEELEIRWSLTPTVEYRWIEPGQDDDDIGGFLDRYEFVPNKSSHFPLELGVRDAALDLLGPDETPRLQLRLESPTSNLGVSGSQIDEPFFNQRALLLGRLAGVGIDLAYRRLRTEEPRLFPNTAGAGLVFEDRSRPGDRFARERTGISGELRVRPQQLFSWAAALGELAAPELALRAGYEVRDGRRQLRLLVDPTNRWFGIAQPRDQQLIDVGAGLLLAPGRLFTVTLDFDHQRFRENAPTILLSGLGPGVPPNPSTIGFVPDTNRYNGTLRLRSRLGKQAAIEGGFQASLLEQVEGFTPLQRAAGLRDNRLLSYSANLSANVTMWDRLGANVFVKLDRRDNDIERDTLLFDGSNGTQVDEFLDRWRRVVAGVEAAYRINAANRVTLGGRFESVERDLDFASAGCPPAPCFPTILPVNALVNEDSESYTVYGRARLRPLRWVGVSVELGYRTSPETGYVTDLDDYVYGELRASYAPELRRPVVFSLSAKGGSGENPDQVLVSGGGIGTPPAGPNLRRHFDRTHWLVGLTGSASPWDRVSVFASLFLSRDEQSYELTLSSLQRYVQPFAPVTFSHAGDIDYENDQWSAMLGAHVDLNNGTDASASYSFTRADTRYGGAGSLQVALVRGTAEIDSNVHSAEIEIRHRLREGLRLSVGYRFEFYADGTDLTESLGSAAVPFDLTTPRHTVTLGVTLSSELLGR